MLQRFTLLLFETFVFLLLLNSGRVAAQSLGDPIVTIDFGAGTARFGSQLTAGITTYTYIAGFPNDGYYTITNSSAGLNSGWYNITDHTGNAGGYFMLANASNPHQVFYTQQVDGLCSGTTYEFAAWAMNLLNYDAIKPNVTFQILGTDGTQLGSYQTGDIPESPTSNGWKQYGFQFTMPAGQSSVIINMTNNAPSGLGNDLALDDITFRPYGSIVSAVFNNSTLTTETTCAGVPQSYTINTTSMLAPGYVQKLQLYENGAWTDISAAGTATSFPVTSPQTAGTYQYRLVSAQTANIGSARCVVSSNYLTIVVNPPPVAGFTSSSPVCLGSPVTFTDASSANGATITSWSWDFGDGHTSTEQNPTYTYTAADSYIVKLTVTADNGCAPATATNTVQVNPLPAAAFTYSSPGCISQPITITDQSTTVTGTTLTSWAWDYGDGSTETKTTNAAFQHTFTAAGSYVVKLTVTNSAGCNNTTSHTVVVSLVPVAGFSLPDVCLSDAYAQFTDESTIDGGSTAGLTYAWNFGDPNATTANPNASMVQNPKHKYSQPGTYTVTLTVTSAAGCVSSIKSRQLTVNGAVPKAGLTVENSSSLCSSDAITFNNTSNVDFGNIIKIVVYFDYDHSPSVSETYLRSAGQIPVDNKFYHSYGAFSTPATKTYHVRMVAYSGETCFDTYDQNLVIHANPVVTLSALGPLCQYDSPVQITENKNGFTGTGTFSGTGVSSTGLFNPTSAGPGTYTINYVFVADNGCSYTSSQQVTVSANPSVSLPASVSLLADGQVTLRPTVQGTNLTYRWTPGTGLSADNIANPVASPASDTRYTLIVKNANGCSATASIDVSVLLAPVVPNTFTPNGDGVNDTWIIKNLDTYPDCRVEIFNRYGEKLFSSVGYSTAWDGRYNGRDLPTGVYYYVITPGNGRKVIAGSLTIIR